MERGSTGHGPQRDEAMAQEVEGYVRAGRDTPGAQAWGSPKPPAAPAEPLSLQEIEQRSELARWLGRAVFPAGRDEVIDHLRAQHAPDAVIARVRGAPADMRFGSSGQLWRSLRGGRDG